MLATRALQGVVVAILVASFTFALVKLAPGDPIAEALDDPSVSPAIRAQWRTTAGLDQSTGVQLWRWLRNAARADFGYAYSQHEPVRAVIARALPYSVLLMGTAIAVSLVLGVALALWQARRANTVADRIAGWLTMTGAAAPEAWVALVVLAVFALGTHLLPVGGAHDPLSSSTSLIPRALDLAKHLVLPVLSIAVVTVGVVARHQRAALVAVAPEAFVDAARSRGLAEGAVWRRHILRNALGPLLTLIGLALPSLAGGAVFIERIFGWPGLGYVATQAVSSRDAPLLAACVMVGALLVFAGSLVADVLHAWLYPRSGHADG